MAYVPAPGFQPVFNPPIPYTTPIAGGALRAGMGVCIQAKLPKNYNRFAFNFKTGECEEADVALHVNLRFDGIDRTVFNSRRNGTWDKEEMKKKLSLKAGKTFVIMFQITQNNYLMSIDAEPYYEFAHRLPIDVVGWINVNGDIQVEQMSILGCGAGTKGSLQLTAAQSQLLPMYGPPSILPTVPFKASLNGGFIPRRSVDLKGVPTGKSFSMNLKVGTTNDIAFHLNPRLNKDTVVRNSCIGGKWGQEETQIAKNPFKEGENYDISIRCAERGFKVFINGSHYFDYAHRFPNLGQVDIIEVEGNTRLFYEFH